MDKKITYHEQTSRENTLKLRSVLQTLPDFTKDFFRAIEPNTSAKTRISYVYDIRLFFQFLQINNPVFAKKDSIKDIRLEDLEQLQPVDIEEYLEYLKYYKDADGVIHTNKERGIHRKLAALRSFYAYYYKREYIHNNPTLIVDMPKLHKREIIRLDPDEVANLLDYVEHGGDEMTGMKKVYFERNKTKRHNSLFLGNFEKIKIVGNKSQFTMMYGDNKYPFIEVHDGCVGMNLNFKYEGIHYRNFFATQLLGPLLILNPYFTDYLIKLKNKDFKLEYKKDIIQNYKNRLELLENRKKYII